MNVILVYTNFLTETYINILKFLLGKNYKQDIVDDYVKLYIAERYYDKFDKDSFYVEMSRKYDNEREYISQLNKIFNYVIYLDDAGEEVDVNDFLYLDIVDSTLYFNEDDKIFELYNYISSFLEKRTKFFEMFDSRYFKLVLNKIAYNTFYVDIEHHDIKISNLYSDFAKEKAFRSGSVNENRENILYYMVSKLILEERIYDLNNNKCYVIELPNTLYVKTRKIRKLLDVIDNDLAKSCINLKITYTDYLKYKTIIDGLIHDGFKFVIILDNSFEVDKDHLDCLIIFDKIIIDKRYKNYDLLIESRQMMVPPVICF